MSVNLLEWLRVYTTAGPVSVGLQIHLDLPSPKILASHLELPNKGMEIHSSTLTWKIPWTEEPDGLQSMGLRRVGHD